MLARPAYAGAEMRKSRHTGIRPSGTVPKNRNFGQKLVKGSKGALAGGGHVRAKISETRHMGIRSSGTNPKSGLTGRPKSRSEKFTQKTPLTKNP